MLDFAENVGHKRLWPVCGNSPGHDLDVHPIHASLQAFITRKPHRGQHSSFDVFPTVCCFPVPKAELKTLALLCPLHPAAYTVPRHPRG
jgi:hypothetical protein